MDTPLRKAEAFLVSALGRQSAFWGMGKTAGEMYAVLYLAAESLSLEELARRLHVTKGNISIAIRQLEQLGMVRRSWQRGDRRVFFEAETDFWKITRSVLALRQKPEFDESFRLVAESAALAEQADTSPEKERAIKRLRALQEFYELLDSMVGAALAMTPDEMKAIAQTLSALRVQIGEGQPEGG